MNKIYTKIIPSDGKDVGYCLGLVEGVSNGFSYYGHGGFWGTTFVYVPDIETSLAIYVLNRDKGNLRSSITNKIVNELAKQLGTFNDITTSDYELYPCRKSNSTLVLFPGGGNSTEDIRTEFNIIEEARQNGISTLLMNFNRHLWLHEEETKELANKLESIFEENKINSHNVHIGGLSIGGNVSLTLSNYLHKTNSVIAPKGAFIVDSPIDLYALYESSVADINNPELSQERLAEPKGIIGFLESNFGKEPKLLENLEIVSPVTLKTQKQNIDNLKGIKTRFYIEPDTAWYRKNRQIDFETTNAYTIQKAAQYLVDDLGWPNVELIQSKEKGYRSNGERNPHSWSIVNMNELINWVKK